MSGRRFHRPTLVSFLVAAGLIAVGVLRFLSYSRATPFGAWIRDSPLAFLAYDPSSYASVRFFKIVATPSVVAMQYFLFRFLNRGHGGGLPDGASPGARRLTFASPWLRLILTSLASAHWIVLEWAKFANPERFYPYSPIEDPTSNMLVLLIGQLLAFFGMKYLSFEPLFTDDGRVRARTATPDRDRRQRERERETVVANSR